MKVTYEDSWTLMKKLERLKRLCMKKMTETAGRTQRRNHADRIVKGKTAETLEMAAGHCM